MKKFVIGVLTIALAALTLFAMTACDKIVKLEITLSLYDAEDEAMEEKTITFDMYENLAESAVNAVRDAVNGGAYDDCVFYVQSVDRGTSVSSQLMFGGLKKSGKSYVKVEQAAVPTAEFEKNGVMGSNLKNLKGYLGLWRSWDSWKSYSTSGFDRSSAVIYMPTTDSISAYDGNFCVFAKYSAEDDLDVIESLIALWKMKTITPNTPAIIPPMPTARWRATPKESPSGTSLLRKISTMSTTCTTARTIRRRRVPRIRSTIPIPCRSPTKTRSRSRVFASRNRGVKQEKRKR